MKPSTQLKANTPSPQPARDRAPHLQLVEPATETANQSAWISHWPMITAIAWTLLLGTTATWWALNQFAAN